MTASQPCSPFIRPTEVFRNVSILIAAINESSSLRKTVEIIYATCERADIAEIVIAVSKKSSPECLRACHDLQAEAQVPFSILVQSRPHAGGAYQDAFDASQGSHVIMMASDLETDPHSAPDLIRESKQNSDSIICTSRWLKRGTFGKGYHPAKYLLNYLFQHLMHAIFKANLTDWTFGYRLFPRQVVTSIKWEESRHPFFLETILKPLSLKVPVREISTSWVPREEGVSQNPFWRNFLYFRTVLRVLFAEKSTFLK